MTIDSVLKQICDEHSSGSCTSEECQRIIDEMYQSPVLVSLLEKTMELTLFTLNPGYLTSAMVHILRCGMILGRSRAMEEILKCQD